MTADVTNCLPQGQFFITCLCVFVRNNLETAADYYPRMHPRPMLITAFRAAKVVRPPLHYEFNSAVFAVDCLSDQGAKTSIRSVARFLEPGFPLPQLIFTTSELRFNGRLYRSRLRWNAPACRLSDHVQKPHRAAPCILPGPRLSHGTPASSSGICPDLQGASVSSRSLLEVRLLARSPA